MILKANPISEYWRHEIDIREARRIFFDKGIVRRELIEDEVAFSWLRCKYKNTSNTLIPSGINQNIARMPLKTIKKLSVSLTDMWIGLFDSSNNLVTFTGNMNLGHIFSTWDFREQIAGFTGIGNCFETRKNSITIGHEHYIDYLTDYVSIGIALEDMTVGILIPLPIADDEMIAKLLLVNLNAVFESNRISSIERKGLNCHFFRNDIHVYKHCLQQFNQLAAQSPYLKVTSSNRNNAYQLAFEIHKESVRHELPFVFISMKEFRELDVLNKLDSYFKGTIYIEDYRWLSIDNQKKICKYIDSKLINSKAEKCLYSSSSSIILSDTMTTSEWEVHPDEYSGLHMRLATVNLVIPSFTDIGHQFKSYLEQEYEKLCSSRWHRDLSLSEEVLNGLKDYSWPNDYSELVYLVDYINEQSFQGSKVPLTGLPSYLLKALDTPNDFMSLKELERQWIKKTLVKTKGNIKKTAEILGITRTTLYKKMEDYNIKA